MRHERLIPLLAAALPLIASCGSLGSGAPAASTGGTTVPAGMDLVAGHLDALDRLGSALPAEQAVLAESARIDFVAVPTASNRLRYALILGTPGHAGFDPTGSKRVLKTLLATPDGLAEPERVLADVFHRELENLLSLRERLRALEAAESLAREQLATANQRNQSLAAENARLGMELEQATRKLAAIAELEKALSSRRVAPEGRP